MQFKTVAIIVMTLALAEATPFHEIKRYYGNETTSAVQTTPATSLTEVVPGTTSSVEDDASVSTWGEWTLTGTSVMDTLTSAAPTLNSTDVTSAIAIPTFTGSSSSTTDIAAFSSASNATWADWISTAAPAATTVSSELVASVVASESISLSTSVRDSTFTYTLGSEGSTTLVTTTIHITETFTLTSTIYATITAQKSGGAFFGAVASAAAADEPTTTTVLTSTTTKTITLLPMGATEASGDSAAVVDATGLSPTGTAGSGFGSNSGSCAVSVVTITTVMRSTITVAATPSSTIDAEVSSTAIIPSYGFGNGTVSGQFNAVSSGFLSMAKPVKPTGM